jgi:hypothetical protein
MNELVAWCVCIGLLFGFVGVCCALTCPFLRTCPACRLSMPRRATRCPHCTTYVTKKAPH